MTMSGRSQSRKIIRQSELPAISAATATVTPAAPAAGVASATAKASAVSFAATRAARCVRPRFVHSDIARSDLGTIHGRDRLLRLFIIGHLDEGKAAWLSGKLVADHVHIFDLSVSFKD